MPPVSETKLCSTTQVDANTSAIVHTVWGKFGTFLSQLSCTVRQTVLDRDELHQVVGMSEQLFSCPVCDQTVFDTPKSRQTNRPFSHTADASERSHNSRWYLQLGQGACGSRK